MIVYMQHTIDYLSRKGVPIVIDTNMVDIKENLLNDKAYVTIKDKENVRANESD